MATREELQRRLSSAEMDEVIERATKLQESSGVKGRSVEDVKNVGRELDIDPALVDQALAQIQEERARAEAAKIASSALKKKVLAGALAAIVGVVGIAGLGSGGVRSAAGEAALARGNLETVLQRQTALVPQLLALSGGDVTALSARVEAVQSAPDVEAKTRAADALQLELAKVVAQLPSEPGKEQQRLSLQHELVGATNRVATERRRYEEAVAAWRQAASGPVARLGVALGFAEVPPAR